MQFIYLVISIGYAPFRITKRRSSDVKYYTLTVLFNKLYEIHNVSIIEHILECKY